MYCEKTTRGENLEEDEEISSSSWLKVYIEEKCSTFKLKENSD